MDFTETKALIGGQWVESETLKTFPVLDPATGENLAEVADCGSKLTSFAIQSAADALGDWSKKKTAKERATILLKIHQKLMENEEKLAEIIHKENGKRMTEAKTEVAFSASFFEWFAAEGRRAYGDTIPSNAPNKTILTLKKPLGVAAFITPWNFPLGMLSRKVAAALAAGCTCVIKPAEDTPLSALYFGRICQQAGVPDGVVNVVPCSRDKVEQVGDMLCTHPKVAVLSFTGSTEVGKALYRKCSMGMKKVHMELGGNAPFIVFKDADLDLAVKGLLLSKFRNAGQTCVTANRILVQEEVLNVFLEKFMKAVKEIEVGPLINERQLIRLQGILKEGVEGGAKIICGGEVVKGNFFQPTIVTGVKPGMGLFDQELFGPVASIVVFKSDEDAIRLANDTDKGLAAYAYTNSLKLGFKLGNELEFGLVGINEPLLSTCEAPFGGIKQSGFGTEGSKHGLDEYMYIKHVALSS